VRVLAYGIPDLLCPCEENPVPDAWIS